MLEDMDNPSYRKDGEKGTELTVVASSNGSAGASQSLVVTCTPEVCRAARQRYQPPDLAGNPWQTKKTVFLLGIIVLFTVWIIVFTILSQLDLL